MTPERLRLVMVSMAIVAMVPSFALRAGARPGPTAGARRSFVTVVSERLPVLGSRRELSAKRPAREMHGRPGPTHPGRDANAWQLLATIPGAVVHDISFPTGRIGYAAAELGQVWKTNDGGTTWRNVMNLGFPYYWYGVDAITATDVVVSGFDDSNFRGILRWSHDGGTTWSSDVVVTTDGWSNRVRFVGSQRGLVVGIVSLDTPNEAQYTTDGGATGADWTTVTPDPVGGWFGADFTFRPDLSAYISGITDCHSTNGGQTWRCMPSVDSVFDGSVEFVNRRDGWVGGGEIAPNVEGWVHVTTDGGATWSDRTLDSPWPVRDIDFLGRNYGWAAGGNVFSGVGGMYLSTDGGKTWALDADTGAEMSSCTQVRNGTKLQVWCAGTTSSFSGVVYRLRLATAPRG